MGRRGIIYGIISAAQKEAKRSANARASAERESVRLLRQQERNLKKLILLLKRKKRRCMSRKALRGEGFK